MDELSFRIKGESALVVTTFEGAEMTFHQDVPITDQAELPVSTEQIHRRIGEIDRAIAFEQSVRDAGDRVALIDTAIIATLGLVVCRKLSHSEHFSGMLPKALVGAVTVAGIVGHWQLTSDIRSEHDRRIIQRLHNRRHHEHLLPYAA